MDFWRNHPRQVHGQYSWAAYDRDEQCWPCQWGTITGIENVDPAGGLELIPAFTANQTGERQDDGSFELVSTFGNVSKAPIGLRVWRSYPPMEQLLDVGALVMRRDDARLDQRLEEDLGVGEWFAAVAVADRAGASEVVTLHDTGEAAALAGARDIDELTVLEDVGDAEGLADLEALEQVAGRTGGRFFNAEDETALAEVYREIDEATTADVRTQSWRPRESMIVWPAGIATVTLLLAYTLLLLMTRRREVAS